MTSAEAESLLWFVEHLPAVIDIAMRAHDLTPAERDRIAAVSFMVGTDHYQRLGFEAVPQIAEPAPIADLDEIEYVTNEPHDTEPPSP